MPANSKEYSAVNGDKESKTSAVGAQASNKIKDPTISRLLWLIALVSSFAALFTYGILRNPNRRDNIDSALLGKTLPAFSIPLFDRYHDTFTENFDFDPEALSVTSGDTLSENKPMVINFWAAWCSPCRTEAPLLESAWQRYKDKIIMLGINTQQRNVGASEEFLEEFSLSFPNGIDTDSRLGIDYGIFGLPETFFVAADGTLIYKHAGPLTQDLLDEKINELLSL